MEGKEATRDSWLRRLAWMALIWAGSIGALAMVALLFRLLMNAAGMTS